MISKELMVILKSRAASLGITQREMSEHFGVSLATIKRWYGGTGLSLEQAAELCDYLGLSLGEALVQTEKNHLSFHYTKEQEVFFAKNPSFLAYFDNLLRGKSIKQISNRFNLSQAQSNKYLTQLDKMNLIELHAHGKYKLLVKGEPKWRRDGALAKRLKEEISQEFRQKKGGLIDKFHLYELCEKDVKTIVQVIEKLLDQSSRADQRAPMSPQRTKSYGLNISLKEYNWSLDHFLF